MKNRMSRSRKAVLSGFALPLIIIAAGLIAVTVLWLQWGEKTDESKDRTICSLEAFFNEYGTKAGVDRAFGMDCPRRYPEIELDKVEKRRKIDDELVKNAIAKEMQKCWADLGTGNPYGKIANLEKFCLICAEIKFDKELREAAKKQNYAIKDFHYYMVAKKPPSLKTTLYESVTGRRPSRTLLNTLGKYKELQTSEFSLDERLVVVWWVGPSEQEKRIESASHFLGWGLGVSSPEQTYDEDARTLESHSLILEAKESDEYFKVFKMGIGHAGETVIIPTPMGDKKLEGVHLSQQILVAPESSLSDRDFCTRLVN
ncbi:hypothetical protein KY349_00345 [Candidatus Woesearchaeota archaeon]|jgi:hypothetical protein|nr:hypothetical protein [Candidatus Woesearchaeota archaeon]